MQMLSHTLTLPEHPGRNHWFLLRRANWVFRWTKVTRTRSVRELFRLFLLVRAVLLVIMHVLPPLLLLRRLLSWMLNQTVKGLVDVQR